MVSEKMKCFVVLKLEILDDILSKIVVITQLLHTYFNLY